MRDDWETISWTYFPHTERPARLLWLVAGIVTSTLVAALATTPYFAAVLLIVAMTTVKTDLFPTEYTLEEHGLCIFSLAPRRIPWSRFRAAEIDGTDLVLWPAGADRVLSWLQCVRLRSPPDLEHVSTVIGRRLADSRR